MKKISCLLFMILLLCTQSVYGGENMEPRVKLETNRGDIILELAPKDAPKTVENFLQYVNDGFYNGTIFHRVIKGFMIQGGGMTTDMVQKPTRASIPNEADNGLKNDRGTVAMARTSDPHSATAQFFINTVDNHFLDFRSKDVKGWGYCVFGKVVKGMQVVDSIENSKTTFKNGMRDVPVDQVVIERATVLEE